MFESRKRLKEIIDTKTKKIHSREKLIDNQREEIHSWQEENNLLYESIKDLRSENEELNLFKSDVVNIMQSKGTIVDKYDKINELVKTAIND